jgi:putative membrane protein
MHLCMKTKLLLLTGVSLIATPFILTSPVTAAEPLAAVAPKGDAADDGLFLASAAYAGTGEIKFSDYAEGRTKREPVKTFATAMVNDHKEMAKQLQTVADKVKVKLPDDLTAEQQTTFEKLKKANDADFDRMYMDTMVSDHRMAVAVFEKAASSSQHPDVKAFATANLPHLKTHLQKAEEIAKSLGSVDATK